MFTVAVAHGNGKSDVRKVAGWKFTDSFLPNSGSKIAPNFPRYWGGFSCSVSWEWSPLRFPQNSPPCFNVKSPAKSEQKIRTNVLGSYAQIASNSKSNPLAI